MSKPPAIDSPFPKDANSSWSLHLFPNAALERISNVDETTSSVRLMDDPCFEPILLMRLVNIYSLIGWNELTRFCDKSSIVYIFRKCLQ